MGIYDEAQFNREKESIVRLLIAAHIVRRC
jgi:hypothetical protein